MSGAVHMQWLKGQLSCDLGGTVWPVCFNRNGYLEVIREQIDPETFHIGMLKHPKIDDEIAFEFRTAAGLQLTGGEHDGLTLSAEKLAVPGPALRIQNVGEFGEDFPNKHYVKLQTLDSRWVAVSGRRKMDRGWSWFAIKPPRQVPISIAENEAGILRLLEPNFALATTFILELMLDEEAETLEE